MADGSTARSLSEKFDKKTPTYHGNVVQECWYPPFFDNKINNHSCTNHGLQYGCTSCQRFTTVKEIN